MNHCEWWVYSKLESPCFLDKQQLSTSRDVGLFYKIWQIFKRICKSTLLEISWLKKIAYLLAKCNGAGRAQGLPVSAIWFVIVTLLVYFIIFLRQRDFILLVVYIVHCIWCNWSPCQSRHRNPGLSTPDLVLLPHCHGSTCLLIFWNFQLPLPLKQNGMERHRSKVGNDVAMCYKNLSSERTTD